MSDTDAIVVGAGLAGLAAARALVAEGRSVVVLEARDRVGGRTLNHELSDGSVVEVGGQWVGPTQTRLLELAAELGVETYPTPGEGLENVIEWRGRLMRYRGDIPRINPIVLVDTLRVQKKLERLARTVPPEAPWTAPNARDLDGQTFHTWLKRTTKTSGAYTIFELACQAVWAAEPHDVSLLHVLFYISSAGTFDDLIGTWGGAQDSRFVGGSQRIALAMAEELGDRILLSHPVREIAWKKGDGSFFSAVGDHRASHVIVAVPPALSCRIAYDPPLPGFRDQLVQRMPQGTVWKCMAVYDEPFWRAEGLSGMATSDAGPVRVAFDNTPHGSERGVLLGFLEGDFARQAGLLAPDVRRAQIVDCFGRLFGERARHPVEYVEKSWAEEEWTRGCYGCAMTTGAWTSFGEALREPIGPLHWAGAEYATTWSGYMDGAIRSGEEAAAAVLST